MSPPDDSWWPEGLSNPSSSGGQNGLQYAFFPEQRRLAVSQGGQVSQYDTGEHRISGVSQQSGSGGPRFTSASGEVDLASLRKIG